MSRIRRAALVLLALAVVLTVGAAGAAAQTAGFEEGFDSPEPAGWELMGGAAVEDGSLVLRGGQAAFLPQGWGDGRLQVTFEYRGTGLLLISYAVAEESRYSLLLIDDGALVLQQVAAGQPAEIGTSGGPVATEATPMTLTVSVTSGEHTVALDGQTVLRATGSAPGDGGGLEIRVEGEREVRIDSVGGESGGAPPNEPTTAAAAATTTTAAAAGDSSGLGDLLDDFFGVQADNVNIGEFALNLALAALLAFILGRAYVLWGSALANRRRFAPNFVLVAVTTTFIILVVRSSVALSLGLVGALSIVRFRAAIKDPEELAYMFLAVGIGIGLGDNQRLITILALAAAIAVIGLRRLLRRREVDFNLHISLAADGPGAVDLTAATAALQPHCSRLRLSRYDESPTGTEAAFLAEFRDADALHRAREALRRLDPGLALTFLDDKGLA